MSTEASVESPDVLKLRELNKESQAELESLRAQFNQVQASFQKVVTFFNFSITLCI